MYTLCSAVSCAVWLSQLCGVICSRLSSDPVHSRKIDWYLFSRDVRLASVTMLHRELELAVTVKAQVN